MLQNPFIQREIERLKNDEMLGESALMSRRLAMEAEENRISQTKL